MPQSLARILIHLVFSTKNRDALISADIGARMHEYLGGTLRKLECPSLQIGGTQGHIHVLLSLGRCVAIADLTRELKTSASSWAKTEGIADFAWQAGYGAFSVSESKAANVTAYIQNQREHHRHRSFQEEYREFLTRHGIAFDERYVWD